MIPNRDRKGKPDVYFVEKLNCAVASGSTTLCIGLDPDLNKLPKQFDRTAAGVVEFNREIIAATHDVVCAYKPNLAFYEALGGDGFDALAKTIEAIPRTIPVIADAKRGDIGNTARAYAEAIFDRLGCDAATVSPYLGGDTIQPFLAYQDRAVFVICRTSNPGAAEFQNLHVVYEGQERPLYEVVALKAQTWSDNGNVGLVVGATAPAELARIRDLALELPFLIPAVGAQGGDIVAAAKANRPGAPAIVSASRSVIYASGGIDFAEAARRAAIDLRDALRAAGRV